MQDAGLMFPRTPRRKLSQREYRKLCEYVLKRDGYCVFCGNPSNLTPAHKVRRSQGGHDSPNNLVAACVRGLDGKAGCHTKYDSYQIPFPQDVAEMLENEPEGL